MNSSLMSSSIFGKEFINYRKNTSFNTRSQYSNKIRSAGIGNVPLVIDSLDKDISLLLSGCDTINESRRNWTYGGEFSFYLDTSISEILEEIEIILSTRGLVIKESDTFNLGLEDGTLVDNNETIGTLYKKYRNTKDKILYLILTKETTIYGYLLSIFKYVFPWFFQPKQI